jgi:hypothetical protein
MLKIMNVRKKPIVVQAVKITPDNMEELVVAFDTVSIKSQRDCLLNIRTLEGNYEARPNNYLMIGVEGEVYPIQGDIFDKTYDIVEV